MINREHIESPLDETNFVASNRTEIKLEEFVTYKGELYLVVDLRYSVRTLENKRTLELFDLLTLRPLTMEGDIIVPAEEVKRQKLLR